MANKPIKQGFDLRVVTEKDDPKIKGLQKLENWEVSCLINGVKATLKKVSAV